MWNEVSLGTYTPHYAPVTEHDARLKLVKEGRCPDHPDIQLKKRKGIKWITVKEECPRCVEEFKLQTRCCPVHPGVIMTKERKFHCGILVLHLVCPVCTSEEIAEGTVSKKDLVEKVALLQTQYTEIASDSRINCREIQSLQLELEAVKDNLKSDEEIDTHYLDMAIERAVHALEDNLLASERTTPPEQVQKIQAIRTDMMKLEAQVTACEGTSQRVVADAMHTMLEQLESIRKDNSLVEIKSEEQRQAFREEIEELQTDLGIVKRTIKNLPTQVQWNTETVKNLLGSFSSLKKELGAKLAEYDSFIAFQKELNENIRSRLKKIEEALALLSNSPTDACLT
jgi:chromosome segregation ATPase